MGGAVTLYGKVKFSMVSIGLPGNDLFDYTMPCIWNVMPEGKIIFGNNVGTNPGFSVIVHGGAVLKIGNDCSFGQNFNLICSKHIEISDNALVSWNVTFMDTDSHYFYNFRKNTYSVFSADIKVGKHCFIGFGSTILKGSVMTDYSLLSCGSVLQDRMKEKSSLYKGVPAQCVAVGYSCLREKGDQRKQIREIADELRRTRL